LPSEKNKILGGKNKVAGAGLERIAPNLLILLVLQECPSDVPTLFPTLDSKIASIDRTLDSKIQRFDGDVVSTSVSAIPLYEFELDTAGRHTSAVKGITHHDKEK